MAPVPVPFRIESRENMKVDSMDMVRELMLEFARDTGLASAKRAPRRYLWTDAFAVCNFLELFLRTKEERFRDLALELVAQVHNILGRHREDDSRTGWISGLDEQEGARNPTRGGLRIGKQLRERAPGEALDDRLEWERDGQYYHYLTKWMHALTRVSRVTREPLYSAWGVELAKTAHARFTYLPPVGSKRMYWKMSIDLSRPLVASMGQHDPLDGLVTYRELNAAAEDFQLGPSFDLRAEIAEMEDICREKDWTTDDPLGIGGLLFDACRVAQLVTRERVDLVDLLRIILTSARWGLEAFARNSSMSLPAAYRLAFRELGLSIGLKSLPLLLGYLEESPDLFDRDLATGGEALLQYMPLGQEIENFWVDGKNREADSWQEHRDINRVMLATSLAPKGEL
ncbi:MAG: hypothetical protein KAT62_14520 [Desulfuromonadales bacterium]|nr:hypothetical protein [Desulfuromonadales bacterium]